MKNLWLLYKFVTVGRSREKEIIECHSRFIDTFQGIFSYNDYVEHIEFGILTSLFLLLRGH